jgi:hypothetical protein
VGNQIKMFWGSVVSLKHQELITHWHNVTSQKNGILTYTAVKMSELTCIILRFGRPCIVVWFLYWYQLDTQFLYKLHKIKFLYMFRASSAHLQEVNYVNCTCMQPLVYSFSAGGRLVHSLRGDSLPLASAQDSHLQRKRIPVAAYMYN